VSLGPYEIVWISRAPVGAERGQNMKNSKTLMIEGIIALTMAAALTPAVAAADTAPATYGSAAILTNRTCITTSNGDCQLGARNFLQYAGGAGSSFTVSATNEANSGASGSAYSTFSANTVPTLGVASFAGDNTRTGASALAYQTYTYSGDAAINLALTGMLHYVGSGNERVTGVQGVEAAGSGFFGANLTILPLSMLQGIGTGADDLIIDMSGLTDCSVGATATTFAGSQGLGAGEHNIPLSLTTACDGGAITIQPGQSFVIMATVQAISNKGGYMDASHTFTSFFDPEKTVFAGTGEAVGERFLSAAIAAVPEPGTWALMLAGFGLVGAAMRRSRGRAVAA